MPFVHFLIGFVNYRLRDYIPNTSHFSDTWFTNIFSQSIACLSIFIKESFTEQKVLRFDKIQFINLSFYGFAHSRKCKNTLPNPRFPKLAIFFLKNFIILDFTFKFMTYIELIFI